jgi:hypothetical protein
MLMLMRWLAVRDAASRQKAGFGQALSPAKIRERRKSPSLHVTGSYVESDMTITP